MKQIPFQILTLIFALLVACSPAQEPELPTASAEAISQVAVTATLVAPMSTIPVATATPLPTATTTPLPTATPTATPLPTATIPPFTQGRIVFLWDQRTEPGSDGPGGFSPTDGLFQAIPGKSPDEWYIQSLLIEKVINQAYLSPDQTKLAMTIMEDIDGDGQYTTWDDYKIHVYHFADGSVIRIDNQETLASRYSLSWMPDNQTVIYPQSSNIALARLDGSSPELLSDNPPDPIEGEPYHWINQVVGSPDGLLQALHVSSGIGVAEGGVKPTVDTLTFFNTTDNTFAPITDVNIVGSFSMRWSPNSRWLTFTGDQNLGLYVLNAQTHEIQQLVDLSNSTTPVWSPNGQQLAFTVNATLYIWDSSTQTVKEITRKDTLSEPAWSPDGSFLATGYSSGKDGGLMFLDTLNYTEQLLPLDMVTNQIVWSPDGEWLTGIFGGKDQVGLYVVNRVSGDSFFVLDTEDFNPPSSIMWLP